MRIFSINNIPVFMQRIRSCTGNVHYEDRNGNYKDLKALAAQLESIEHTLSDAKLNELTVYFEKEEDCCKMVNYLVEMALVS